MKINNKVCFIIGLLFPAMLFAQNNNSTTSPYSRFGLGDLQTRSFGRTFAMGGASLGSRNSLQINMANPASYTVVDSLAFLFEFGLNGKLSSYRTNTTKMTANDVNFRYLSMGFRITDRLAASLGLTPYSDVGYDIRINNYLENTGNYGIRYFGDGSLTRSYIGFAINPFKNISVGANLNYLFGNISNNAELYFDALTDDWYNNDFYNTRKNEYIRVSQFGFDFGLQATIPLVKNQSITLGAVLENKPEYAAYRSDMMLKNLTVIPNPDDPEPKSDQDTLKYNGEEKGSIRFPFTYGIGVSYVKTDVLELNLDYYHQSWSEATFFGSINPVLTDLNKFAVGAEWIPNKNSIRSYSQRIAYRAGFKYEESYLKLNGRQINDFGISFGIGLPISRSYSTINVAAEIGKRGTRNADLISERYVKLNLNVNLHDIWFLQTRYD
ncbi:MAG: hypothetical protein LBV47_02465 [Bacteroidales bacterium]|jgi:hypothetical protein|nr:hypothetical protein [Bacteroidales bacterium]